jgi:PAS domain-containing protein
VQATGRDVSARAAAQEALEESQKNFRMLIDRMPIRMLIDRMPNGVVIHRHKHVVYANPSFARVIGYETAESRRL